MSQKIKPQKQNSEFSQLEENDSKVIQTQAINTKSLTFDDILTNSMKFGKYQYIAALIICTIY